MLSYKQSRRREDDLAIVNAGLRVLMIPAMEEVVNESDGGWTIGECNLVYGGMNYKTVMAIETQQKLIGRFVARFKIAMFCMALHFPILIQYCLESGMRLHYRRQLVFYQKSFNCHQMLPEECQSIVCHWSPLSSSSSI